MDQEFKSFVFFFKKFIFHESSLKEHHSCSDVRSQGNTRSETVLGRTLVCYKNYTKALGIFYFVFLIKGSFYSGICTLGEGMKKHMDSQNAKAFGAFRGRAWCRGFVSNLFALILTPSQNPFEMVPENKLAKQ